MANFGPFGAKTNAFLASPLWHYVYSGFSQNRSILKKKKKNVFGKNAGAPKKNKNFMGRTLEIDFDLFFKTLILRFGWQFPDRKSKNPIFLAVLGIFALRCKMPASAPIEPNMHVNLSFLESFRYLFGPVPPSPLFLLFALQQVQVQISLCHFLLCSWATPFAQKKRNFIASRSVPRGLSEK